MDLQNSKEFQALGVALLSIAFDAPDEMLPARQSLGIEVPMLTDSDHSVSQAYGVLQWAVATGEPGHTFVLVSRQGDVSWIQDYGAAENRGVMYVDPSEITAGVSQRLESP